MDRAWKFALLSLIFNIIFGAYHIAFGLLAHSQWLLTIGLYDVILSVVRFAVLRAQKQSKGVRRFAGIMLMALVLPLVGTVIMTAIHNKGTVMHEIVMIAMATYAFTKITLAAVNLVKTRRRADAGLEALRKISFADACVSIFALQRSMLVSFGDMPQSDVRIFNIVIGSLVCGIVFLIGLNLARGTRTM